MKRETQKEKNPFLFSDSNKRYYTYDYYLRQTFGEKCEKLPLDGGFTCPNIDGRCGRGGCIYCSGRGSGDFAESALLSVPEQYRRMREKEGDKWSARLILPYFQAHTNTYAPLSKLKALFEEALLLPGAVGLNIATRADCLPDDVLSYLAELSKRTHLTVELGLQTSDDESAAKKSTEVILFPLSGRVISGFGRPRPAPASAFTLFSGCRGKMRIKCYRVCAMWRHFCRMKSRSIYFMSCGAQDFITCMLPENINRWRGKIISERSCGRWNFCHLKLLSDA